MFLLTILYPFVWTFVALLINFLISKNRISSALSKVQRIYEAISRQSPRWDQGQIEPNFIRSRARLVSVTNTDKELVYLY